MQRSFFKIAALIISILTLPSINGSAQIDYILNDRLMKISDTIFIKKGDKFLLRSNNNLIWIEHKPVYKIYTNVKENLSPRINYYDNIEYTSSVVSFNQTLDVSEYIKSSGPGTYYFSRGKFVRPSDKLSTPFPIHKLRNGIIQVVLRYDDSYISYLEELFNTPFIWTPKTINTLHQCDERIGSDCISFVIYGRRRLGFDVRYSSLDKVKKHLNQIVPDKIKLKNIDGKEVYTIDDKPLSLEKYSIKKGTFLHFGIHAAIFYEDRGIPGVLDREDIVIQSTGLKPSISTLRSTDYSRHTLGIYEWKE